MIRSSRFLREIAREISKLAKIVQRNWKGFRRIWLGKFR
jgi:hypothetical protein